MERLDDIIDAIMDHPLLGQNPNSVTACALGRQGVKEHIVEYFGSWNTNTKMSKDNAIKEMVELEDCHLEQGLNCRWGEDSDPQLIAYKAFEKLKTEHPL